VKQQTRLEALSIFLKTQRTKIDPSTVGLPIGSRRRTSGLRREEVAMLAGVSTTWYTWLEQGRDIRVSGSVLDAVCRALQLTKDERKYVHALALESEHPDPTSHLTEVSLSPSLQKILQELRYCPTIISDRRSQIVGWNTVAEQVFLNFHDIVPEQRNIIQLLFVRKELRSLAVNWETFVLGFLAIFRACYGQYVSDEWYGKFIERMSGQYPEFDTLWNQTQVNTAPEVMIEFRHSKAGRMLFELTSFQVQGNEDLRCSIYTPVSGSSTESKLRRLLDASVK
jgi:transcriptional regulator with XRE-family HTH domain